MKNLKKKKNKKILLFIFLLGLFLAAVFLTIFNPRFLQENGIARDIVKYFSTISYKPSATTSVRPPEVKCGESFTLHGYKVTVDSIRVGKSRGSLPDIPPEDMHIHGMERKAHLVKTDDDGTFLDNHLYVEVSLTVENESQTEYSEFLASSCVLLFSSPDEFLRGPELSTSTFSKTVSTSKNESKLKDGTYSLLQGESMTGRVGFVISEEDLTDAKSSLYFCIDLFSDVISDPEASGTSWVKVPDIWES